MARAKARGRAALAISSASELKNLRHDLERLKQSETDAINEVERLREELKMARLEAARANDFADAVIKEMERLHGIIGRAITKNNGAL